MPGGHLEHGESMLGGAARELLEETGLTARGFEFASLANGPQGERHYVHVGVKALGVVGEPQNLEPDACYGWEWFDLQQLPSPVFPPHLLLIEAALENRLFTDTQ